MTGRYAVYGFESTHDALAAERALADAAVAAAAIPAPKSLGALCGIALRVALHDASRLEEALVAAGIQWTRRVEIEDRLPRSVSR